MEQKNYKDTLNLPNTDFPMKANLPEKEPKQIDEWEKSSIYKKMTERNTKKKYIFHDGPPYANGHLHLGTMLNKILKDIVIKYKNMTGFRCEMVPGWDCHGLPIELAVERELGPKKRTMEHATVRKACREHAATFVDIQRNEFRRLGCFARWEKPYMTMSYDYESSIAREFGKFVKADAVYKGKRPIYWCASCKTALAEAEVEYADHVSHSIYVKFKLLDDEKFRKSWKLNDEKIYLVIWTTTPWTIPANLAIALNPDLDYVAVKVDGEVWIVAEGLLDAMMTSVGKTYSTVVGKPKPQELEHKKCRHPLIERDSLVILGEHVTLEAGTGAVHTAPGHGQEDFDIGMKYGLEILAPIDDAGRFTNECGLSWLVGTFVEDANKPIMQKLTECGALVKSGEVSHSYPHCWRCKHPILFRVTDQWFISMEKNDLRKKAIKAIDEVEWIPPWGKNRIGGMVATRPDWCISRQRLWGVPIIALVCESCGNSHTTYDLVEKTADIFEKEGADAWYIRPAADFKPKGFKCPSCGEKERFGKEPDILDVWFDSGVSFAAVIENEEGIKDQIDLYLEGSDQHRGWFHTSLLASIGTRSRAPYKRVLTHGFVVDGDGRKYSKSAKNYVPPEKLLNQYGAEILRLWVSAEDYRDDIRFSNEIITRCVEAYRKVRNTVRYLLGNLGDFDPSKDLVAYDKMEEIDKFAVGVTWQLIEKVLKGYEEFEFHVIYHTLNRFCTVEMSSFYLDILKDRLYAEKKDGHLRRSAQTALWTIADAMTRIIAPIFSFTSEEIWKYLPKAKTEPESIFLTDMPKTGKVDEKLIERFEKLIKVRQTATKALENARADKFIGNSLAAKISISCDDELKKYLESFGESLSDLFIVSQIEFSNTPATGKYAAASDEVAGLSVDVFQADGQKCDRCWKYSTTIGENANHPTICRRCAGVLS